MILQAPPGSPWLIQAAAQAILVSHIGGGLAGVVSGFVALLARKGGRLHGAAGRVFFVSMLIMAGIGTVVSPFLPSWSNVMMGLFVLYLITTAWMTVRRPAGVIGRFEVGAAVFAGSAATLGVLLGVWASASPGGQLAGDPPAAFFILASFPALAGALDVRMIRNGGLSGGRRVTRHLWRMGVALFVATGSLFLGQQKLFPHALRGSPIMFAPEFALLALLIYWIFRTRNVSFVLA